MPALTDDELIDKFKIKPTDKILDVGGSAKQHGKLQIDTIVDIVRPEKTPYWQSNLTAKHFVKKDITREKLPFSNKEFDFVLCTHTLEDLDIPFLAMDEMSRVGKRGYIATPSRGKDSEFSHFDLTDWLTGSRRVPGLAHHQWFFENESNTIIITSKNYPLLYTSEFQITKWLGEDEFQFYWENKIRYKTLDDTGFHKFIVNYRDFMNKNKKLIKKGSSLIYLDNPFYVLKAYLKLILRRGVAFKELNH